MGIRGVGDGGDGGGGGAGVGGRGGSTITGGGMNPEDWTVMHCCSEAWPKGFSAVR